MNNIDIYAHITAKDSPLGNLGDKMGYLIAQYLFNDYHVNRMGMRQRDIVNNKTVAIVGSLLQVLSDSSAQIVGGGLINENKRDYSKDIKVHGVRGFLTKSLLFRDAKINVPVIGDPGLLISDIFKKKDVAKKKPLGFIIHKVDRELFFQKFPDYKDLLIDNYLEPEKFVEQISNYQAVVSTSFHGRVFSHAYGIPVKPFVLSDEVFGGEFKFQDYYSSYGLNVTREKLSENLTYMDLFQSVISTSQPTLEQIYSYKKVQENLIRKVIMEARYCL